MGDITWQDCGTSSTHGKVTNLTPTTLTMGQETTMTGTGTVDEGVTDGSYNMEVKAGFIKETYSGDICEAKTFTLPLKLGTLKFDGMSCPISKGSVDVSMDIELSSAIPTSLASASINMIALDVDHNQLLCLQVNTKPQ